MRAWLIMLPLLGSAVAPAQEPNDADLGGRFSSEQLAELQQKAMRLIQATQDLGDWNEHYTYMLDAVERVFERNHWESESDLFALEVVREVGEIPPWDALARFDKAIEMVGDRYLLDEGQMASLQGHFIRANVDLFARHADRIMDYAIDAIETRAAGEPFTPEQIARWTELAEPVFLDARRSVNEIAKEFGQELDPEQRELLQRDVDAANRRMGDMERLAQRWKRGEWDPHDWGMEDDPIQNRGTRVAQPADETEPDTGSGEPPQPRTRPPTPPDREEVKTPVAESPARQQAPTRPSTDNDPWAQYVRDFIKKYDLNDEQQQRAWLYYRDAKERDAVFARRYERRTQPLREKVDDDERARAALKRRTEEHSAERDRLFGQLKRRLERLPTRAQRKNAQPDNLHEPTSSPGTPRDSRGQP